MERFVGKIDSLSGKYVFAVGTYGLLPNRALKHFGKAIASRGGELASGFVVRMPHSGLGGPEKNRRRQQILARWVAKLPEVCDCIAHRQTRRLETTNFFVHGILGGAMLAKLPTMLAVCIRVMRDGWESFSLAVDGNCDGCGICEKICPSCNIAVTDGKPLWHDHCVMCFACLQWCPRESVQAGRATVGYERYHHPDITLADMLRAGQSWDEVTAQK